jgi:DNA-binding YbaB/EbfC family protein
MAKKKRRGGFGGGMGAGMGGGGGMGNLMSQMSKLQEEMEKTQAELAEEELTISAGGGMVTVVVTGAQEIRSIKIEPDAVDPDDVEMLEDLVLAAVTEALQKSNALQEERMGALTGGMGLPPGLGF